MKRQKKHTGSRGTKNETTVLLTPKNVAWLITRARGLAEPLCEAEGFELVHVEFQPEAGGRILRFYIDKPDGVTLDECAYVSRQISDLLDVSLEGIGSYNLEISSPGPERPLGKESDYERFKGKAIRLKTYHPINGQKNFKGVLSGISEGIVEISMDDRTVVIPFGEIHRARLVNHGEKGCLYQT